MQVFKNNGIKLSIIRLGESEIRVKLEELKPSMAPVTLSIDMERSEIHELLLGIGEFERCTTISDACARSRHRDCMKLWSGEFEHYECACACGHGGGN